MLKISSEKSFKMVDELKFYYTSNILFITEKTKIVQAI